MYNKNYVKIFALILTLTVLQTYNCKGQSTDTPYNVSINIGTGFTRYVTALPQTGLDRNSFNIAGRIMWEPEHLLSIGIESGYIPLYSLDVDNYSTIFGTTDVELSLTAIPFFLTFGMKIFPHFIIYGGVGGASLNSTADYFENRVVSTSWTNAYQLSCEYIFYEKKGIEFGSEFKWINFSKIEDSALLLQIKMKYILYSY